MPRRWAKIAKNFKWLRESDFWREGGGDLDFPKGIEEKKYKGNNEMTTWQYYTMDKTLN